MAKKVTGDRFATAMGTFGSEVLKTSLSEEGERELAEQPAGPAAA